MTRAQALAEAQRLKAIMERHGVRCSIELQQGRPWSAYDGWFTPKYAIVNHHTAGSRSGLTPSLALCKRGRSDLPGPLCNGYGGRDHVYRILCMGLANHPGAGGPITVAGFRIPKDSARISTWGTEWEHDGVSPWPADMREFMGRANAALLEWLDRPVEASIEHSTWTSRKIDRNGYSAADGQREIERWSAIVNPPPVSRPPASKPTQPAPIPELAAPEGDMLVILNTTEKQKGLLQKRVKRSYLLRAGDNRLVQLASPSQYKNMPSVELWVPGFRALIKAYDLKVVD